MFAGKYCKVQVLGKQISLRLEESACARLLEIDGEQGLNFAVMQTIKPKVDDLSDLVVHVRKFEDQYEFLCRVQVLE